DRAAPEDLLARLAELDLDIYDDPGQTEALAAGSFAADDPGETQVLPTMTESDRTEALPAHGAAAAGATVPLAAGSSAAAPVHDLEADDRGVDDGETDDRGAEDLDRTQALPALGENDTRALPASPPSEPSEPATEVLQPVQDRTSVLPVVRDPRDPGAHQHPFQHAPQQHAPEQYAPHQQAGAPGQFHHGYPLAPPPPRRTLLVLLGHAILIGLAAVAPYIALTLLLLLGGASRTWEQSHQALQVRRGRGAGGAGATWMVGLAWPFRFVLNVLQVALVALFPLILGLLLAFSIDAVLFYLGGGTPLPTGAMTAIAMGITVLLTWFGIGGRTLRAGAHRALAAATPDRVWTLLMALLLLGLLAAVIITVLARSVEIDYFPFWTGPRVEDIAFWRR
ncbi:MAG: serine/threonine protein kinase, partial [Brachybacterium sp.]|nr:serine/threonine protein kinase [Brachybacterium sp.]